MLNNLEKFSDTIKLSSYTNRRKSISQTNWRKRFHLFNSISSKREEIRSAIEVGNFPSFLVEQNPVVRARMDEKLWEFPQQHQWFVIISLQRHSFYFYDHFNFHSVWIIVIFISIYSILLFTVQDDFIHCHSCDCIFIYYAISNFTWTFSAALWRNLMTLFISLFVYVPFIAMRDICG